MINLKAHLTQIESKIQKNQSKLLNGFVICILIGIVISLFIRAFYGTEFTDEAYYVAEAKSILNGNVPLAYNTSTLAFGFPFLLVPFIYLYSLFIPNLEGIFLATRLFFVAFKVIISIVLYFLYLKGQKKVYALLLVGAFLPFIGFIQNFNYNSIPIWLLLLVGMIIFDVTEYECKHRKTELFVAGFLGGIAICANPGWAFSLVIFAILFVIRDKKKKVKDFLLFCCAFCIELLVVFIPIIIATSFDEVSYGIYRLLINPIPVDPLTPTKSYMKLFTKVPYFNQIMIASLAVLVVLFFLRRKLNKENNIKIKQNCILIVSLILCISIIFLGIKTLGTENINYILGFISIAFGIVFFILDKNNIIFWYLGIYPIILLVAIIIRSTLALTPRFLNCVTLIIPILYFLFKQPLFFTRITATIIALSIIIFMSYSNFAFIYRDEKISELTYKVESGVYKGIFTTQSRSKDVVELEKYLNETVGASDTYAFRDNVPVAYLMMNKGVMCEMSTWDDLQYAYGRNTPSTMFDYYRRRNLIPEYIIYIDFGIDEKLSIESEDFKYNDWVNQYYDKIDDVNLNNTFKRIIVYKYNGTFDNNYQKWIDDYWKPIDNED